MKVTLYRVGKVTKGQRSYNHWHNCQHYENGISVQTPKGLQYYLPDNWYNNLNGYSLNIYAVTGDLLHATGSDGEPLLDADTVTCRKISDKAFDKLVDDDNYYPPEHYTA